MTDQPSKPQFVICIRNDGYAASLEKRKLYRRLPDSDAESRKLGRVVDESGEDYLYPAEFFLRIGLPPTVVEAITLAERE